MFGFVRLSVGSAMFGFVRLKKDYRVAAQNKGQSGHQNHTYFGGP